MGRKKKSTICVSLQQAKLIELARAVEESGDRAVKWTAADAESASLRAAHALGEDAGAARVLAERARLVLAAASERGVSTSVGTKARLPLFLAPVFILGAYIIGALSDRIASSEHFVNLLSPPFWTVIVWNILVYCVLFLCALGILGNHRNHFSLPLRSVLNAFVEKSAFSTLSFRKGFKSAFYARWSVLAAPLVRMHVARVLHFSAIAFALGLITSLLVRGFGTSYWAGWESTWLADSPEAVKNFLDYTYGLIPSIGGLPPMPDLETVVSMRADNLPYLKNAPSAAPWLIRMMLFMVLAVVLPRLVFVLFDSWRIRRFRNRVVIDLDDPYYADILVQCAEDAALGRLFIVTSTVERTQREQTVTRVRRYWGLEADSDTAALDFDDPDAGIPVISAGARRTVVALWLDAVQTPEADTHGLVIDKLRAACDTTPGTILAGILDLTEFSEHFAQLPARIKERAELWNSFAQSRGLTLFILKPGADEQLGAVKKLRGWAATQNASLTSGSSSSRLSPEESSGLSSRQSQLVIALPAAEDTDAAPTSPLIEPAANAARQSTEEAVFSDATSSNSDDENTFHREPDFEEPDRPAPTGSSPLKTERRRSALTSALTSKSAVIDENAARKDDTLQAPASSDTKDNQ